MSDVLQRWLNFLQGDGFAVSVAFAIAAVGAALAVWPVRRLALRLSAIDVPGGRHLHLRPTARLGGLAILLAFWVAWPIGQALLGESRPEVTEQAGSMWAILVVGSFVCALGARDDVRGLSAGKKLLGLAMAGVALVLCDVRVDFFEVPLLGKIALGPWAGLATVAWVVACANAVNLIDGVDGLGSGVTMVSACALALVAFGVGDPGTALGFAVVAGACAGFLLHNREPARIFLGDSGALTLGFVLAALSASGCTKRATAVFLFAGLCALSVPLLDSSQAFSRRFLRGCRGIAPKQLWAGLCAAGVGDREHIHHRLLQRGLSHRQVTRVLSLGTMAPCLLTLSLLPSNAVGWTTVCGAGVAATYVLLRLAALPRSTQVARTESSVEKTVVLPAQPPRTHVDASVEATALEPESVARSSAERP